MSEFGVAYFSGSRRDRAAEGPVCPECGAELAESLPEEVRLRVREAADKEMGWQAQDGGYMSATLEVAMCTACGWVRGRVEAVYYGAY